MSIQLEDLHSKIERVLSKRVSNLKSVDIDKEQFDIDVGNLIVNDRYPIEKSSSSSIDRHILESGRCAVQALINEVYALQRKSSNNLLYAVLPKSTTVLPREKAIPVDKPLTKWEQYAKEKGIKKKKSEQKTWDEIAEKWVPTYGKMKVQVEKEKNWVMEVPMQADPFEDQFKKVANKKKEVDAKNQFQKMRNLAREMKGKTPGVGVMTTQTKDVSQLKKAMHFSRSATASMGKFQPKLKGEKDIKGFGKNVKKEGDKPLYLAPGKEAKMALKIVDKLHKPVVNVETQQMKQVQQELLADEVQKRREAKQSGRRSQTGGRKKSKSGAALAALSGGKQGDKRSKKEYLFKKNEESKGIKKKGNRNPRATKGGGKKKQRK